jgi:hypothetical protein
MNHPTNPWYRDEVFISKAVAHHQRLLELLDHCHSALIDMGYRQQPGAALLMDDIEQMLKLKGQ